MSSSNVDVKLQRITSVPRSAGLYLSIAAMLVGATAISIASAALYKLKYEQQKVTANEKLWLGMEEVRNCRTVVVLLLEDGHLVVISGTEKKSNSYGTNQGYKYSI